MKKITEFNPGDEVVRIIPAEPYSPLTINIFGQAEGGLRDRSYMGEKLIFVGIANGQIYLKRTGQSRFIFGDKLISLSLDIWSNGWDNWIDPETLFGINAIHLPEGSIEDQISEALSREDYELVAKLKKKQEQNEQNNLSTE